MTSKTWQDIEAAVRAAWSLDTCDLADVNGWSPANPARGQCGSTALTVHDLLGGELLVAEVLYGDGTRQGFHWWNRLPDGTEVDATREQFGTHEHIQQPRLVARPAGLPLRGAEQYLVMRERVMRTLGIAEASRSALMP